MSYKFDRNQIILLVLLGINIFTFLILPYRESIDNGTQERGFSLILSWICLAILFRIVMHSFGFELYNLNGGIVGFSLFYSGLFLLNYVFFTSETHDLYYSYIIITLISSASLVGICYLDREQYDILTRLKEEEDKI